MRLSALSRGFTLKAGASDPEITLVTEDSRMVRPGALFVAVPGTTLDGHTFISDALARTVPSAREALATLSARFHGEPAQALRLIGFTGTFGKTTTSDILQKLLDAAGRRTGVIGSVGAHYGRYRDDRWGLTTPSPPELHRYLAELKRVGADTVILEVTSHALRLQRVHGLRFGGGLLAAIESGEHTDFHRSFEDYVGAKRLLLRYQSPEATLTYDEDNAAARQLAAEASVTTKAGFTIGGTAADPLLPITDIRLDSDGATFRARDVALRSALLGRPNVRNVALALTYALSAGLPIEAARQVLASLAPVKRRMERLTLAGRTVLDDTAGHPDSFAAVFEMLSLLPRRRLWIAWAVRGNRGVDVNRANALALADYASLSRADGLFVSASHDVAGDTDRTTAAEHTAVAAAFSVRGRSYVYSDTLRGTMEEVARGSSAGDLILLVGAQGMDEGARLLGEALDVP
jgi:UDP-N-acetylmuramoyl-L-alanyl-D-glutamate--2,6-diaminopimelate ligase